MQKVTVLWVIKGLGLGGAERLLASSLPYLDRDTYDYEIAYFDDSKGNLVPEFERAGISVVCLHIRKPYDIRVIFRLLRVLRSRRTDILHVHSPYWGTFARVLGKIAGVKAIISTEHQFVNKLHPMAKALNVATYGINDAVIGVSEAVVSSLKAKRRVREDRLYVVHNGIDTRAVSEGFFDSAMVKASLGIDERNFLVLTVANIKPQKGHQYLLMAMPLLLAQIPNTTFVFVGRPKSRSASEQLEKMAKRLGVSKSVIFAGFRPDVFRLVSSCDVFVLPSLWEPFGIVLLEAMSLGKPVVATRVGGIPEIIADGVNGYLVEPKEPRALSEKIAKLLENEPLRNKMGQTGRETVRQRFDIRKSVVKTEQIYSSILDSKGILRRRTELVTRRG